MQRAEQQQKKQYIRNAIIIVFIYWSIGKIYKVLP